MSSLRSGSCLDPDKDLDWSTPYPSSDTASSHTRRKFSDHEKGSSLNSNSYVTFGGNNCLADCSPPVHNSTSYAKQRLPGLNSIHATSIGTAPVPQGTSIVLRNALPVLVQQKIGTATESEHTAARRRCMLWEVILEEIMEHVYDSTHDFDPDLTQPSHSKDLATLRESMWDSSATARADKPERRFQMSSLNVLSQPRLYMLLYAGNRRALHPGCRPPIDPCSPPGLLKSRKNVSIDFGSLGILPAELFLMVIELLSQPDKTSLALTNTSFWKALDGADLWQPFYEIDKRVKMQVLSRLDRSLGPVTRDELYACSICLTSHRSDHFGLVEPKRPPEIRKCLIRFGQAHLGPYFHFDWINNRKMGNNTMRAEHAVLWRNRNTKFSLGNTEDKTRLNRVSKVDIHIYKVEHKDCVQTRWEFPYLTEAARLGAQWTYLNRLPGELQLCPHNRFGREGVHSWVGRHSRRRCDSVEHGFDCVCFDLSGRETTRCRFCATDISQIIEVSDDEKECCVITTDKILGDDENPGSREWESQCSEDETSFCPSLCGVPDHMAYREGGCIRNLLDGLERGTPPLDKRFPSPEELWGNDCRRRYLSYPRDPDPRPRFPRIRVGPSSKHR